MKIEKVTFTGFDDLTSYAGMVDISQNYPWVEWGILVSMHHSGKSARYPSPEIIKEMFGYMSRRPAARPNFAMHVCGVYCRKILRGDWQIFEDMPFLVGEFKRIQLNFHDEKTSYDTEKFINSIKVRSGLDIIFQVDNNNRKVFDCFRQYQWAAPLFDLSGGAGIVPEEWPRHEGKLCGYAGGLGPHNLNEELMKIEYVVDDGRIWIDMETHVRTNGFFDLKKVEKCLEILKPWI